MIPSEYRKSVQINPLTFPLLLVQTEEAVCWTNQPTIAATESEKLYARLTPQEKAVVSKIAQGYRAKEIGNLLGISSFTVHTHVQHIFAKTKARNSASLIYLLSKIPL